MLEAISVHFAAGLDCVTPISKGYEGKALRKISLAVFGEENACDSSEAFEHLTKFMLFSQFRDLEESISNRGFAYDDGSRGGAAENLRL